MYKKLLLSLAFLSLAIVAVACSGTGSADTADDDLSVTLQPNVPASDFTAKDVLTGQPVSLSRFEGSTVVLNLVNYGCNPAQSELVSRQLLAIRNLVEQGGDFVPVSVFCGCCPEDVLKGFAQENNLAWPWILDADYSIVNQYVDYLTRYGYPTLIIIDKDQTIREVTGYLNQDQLSAKLKTISLQTASTN